MILYLPGGGEFRPAGGRWPSRLELEAGEEACWPALVKIPKEYSRKNSAKKTTPKEKEVGVAVFVITNILLNNVPYKVGIYLCIEI